MDFRSLLNPGSPPTALSPPRSRMSLDIILSSTAIASSTSSPFHPSPTPAFHDSIPGRTTRKLEDDSEEEEDAIALAGGGTLLLGKEVPRASADAAVPGEGVPVEQLAGQEERAIQHEELPSIALPSEDSPMELDDPIPSSSHQPYLPAPSDAMDLDPVASPTPSSSHLVPDSDADADGEEDPSPAFSGVPEPAIKPEDLEVDIMSHDSSESPPPHLRLAPHPKPKKATQAQKKAARVKGGKARQALYGSLSHASPHSLSHELSLADDEGSEETTREGTPEGGNTPVRMPFAFPFVADAVRTPLPEGAVESAFEGYVPHRGSDTEDEGEKVRTRKGKGRVKEVEHEVEEEGDDRLYCVCRRLYDPERTMIACDKCENWYHLDCIDITDKKVDLVDQFICPLCQQSSLDRTTWKTCCARPTCLHPAVPLSKYCSDYCGIEVAATRLELCGMDPERFWPNVVGARRREGAILDSALPKAQSAEEARREEDEDERTLSTLRAKLSDLVARRQVLDGNLALINARLRYLRIAIRRWEALCQATADALASEGIQTVASSSKSKAKGRSRKAGAGPTPATSLPDAQCGLDVRLVYDRAAWEAWVEGEEGRAVLGREEGTEVEEGFEMPDEVCMRPRKKCERHTGWQKVRQADFEVEKAVLSRRLDRLAVDERRIRGRIEDHEEASRFRALHRNRVGDALSVEGKMKAPARMTPTKPQWGGRAVGGAAGGNLVNGTVVPTKEAVAASSPCEVERSSYEVGDEGYDVPPEVYAFLSRSEQLKVRGRAR